jgi:predicted nuclease of predicted toxin-antitoxin system
MRVILDNNLPCRMASVLRSSLPDVEVAHLNELGASDWSDDALRKRWASEFVVWVTRDEDFWMDSPTQWAIVWVNCHNPRLTFLTTSVAPLIAGSVSNLRPGSRLLISEDMAMNL